MEQPRCNCEKLMYYCPKCEKMYCPACEGRGGSWNSCPKCGDMGRLANFMDKKHR